MIIEAGNMPDSNAGQDSHQGALTRPFSDVYWYATYVSANHEKKVAFELQRRSVEHFLPLYGSVRRWKDRRVKLDMPLFPGYVFVHFSLQERLRVLQVPGVVKLVGFSSCAVPVPEIEISRIRDILNQGFHAQPHPYLTVGRRVRVKAGPLAQLEGVIVKRKNRKRLVISFDLIQRSVAVDVSEEDLALVS